MRGKKQSWVRLTFLGAGRQVGRSCFLLQTESHPYRLRRQRPFDRSTGARSRALTCPRFNIADLDGRALTLASTTGFIPYCSSTATATRSVHQPTRDVASLLMLDFIQDREGREQGLITTSEHVKGFRQHVVTLEFEEVTDIAQLTFYNANPRLLCRPPNIGVACTTSSTGGLKFGRTPLFGPGARRASRAARPWSRPLQARANVLPPEQEQDEMLVNAIKETIARGGRKVPDTRAGSGPRPGRHGSRNLVGSGQMDKVPVYTSAAWSGTSPPSTLPILNSEPEHPG